MVHGAVRGLFQLLGATFAVIVAIGAGLALRLSSGPVHLDVLTPYIQEALSAPDGSFVVRLDTTVLAWGGWNRNLEIRAEGVRALTAERGLVASVPEISFALSVPALATGTVAPRSLEFIRPSIRLFRDATGAVHWGLGDTSPDVGGDSTPVVQQLLDTLSGAPDGGVTGYLERVAVKDGDLTIVDQAKGVSWHAPDADIDVKRDSAGIVASAQLTVQLGDERARLNATARFNRGDKMIAAQLGFHDVRPAVLATFAAPLAALSAFDMPLSGEIKAVYGMESGLDELSFDIMAGKGALHAPAPISAEFPFQAFALKGRLANQFSRVTIDEMAFDLGGPTLTMNGEMESKGAFKVVRGEVLARGMPADVLKHFWPPTVASNPREWVVGNLSKGMVHEARAKVQLRLPEGKGADAILLDDLSGEIHADGMTVQYLAPMPVVTGAAADVTFDKNAMRIAARNGELYGLKVPEAVVVLSGLTSVDQFADITVKVTGPLSDALKVIDSKPLGFAQALGIPAAKVKGDSTTVVKLKFPLIKTLTFDGMSVRATATATHLSIPAILMGLDISDGELALDVDPKGMDVAGKVVLGTVAADLHWRENFSRGAIFRSRYALHGVANDEQRKLFALDGPPFQAPFLTGPVTADVVATFAGNRIDLEAKADLTAAAMRAPGFNWGKLPGTPAQASAQTVLVNQRLTEVPRFAVTTASGANVAGSVAFDNGQIRKVSFTKAQFGGTDIAGTLGFRANGGLDVDVKGPVLDATEMLAGDPNKPKPDRAQRQAAKKDDDLPPMTVTAQLGQVTINPAGGVLRHVAAAMTRDAHDWRTARIDATVGAQGAEGKPFHLDLKSTGTQRPFHLTSDDAGAVFRAFDVFDNLVGGDLVVDGAYDDSVPSQPAKGRVRVTDYHVEKAPALARLLNVAALTGILDLLQGEGISFSVLDAPFTLTDGLLELAEARASGPALGLTARGSVDLDTDVLALEGTVVPAYAVNSLLGNIPLLGKLLVGEKGGGVFAAKFSMRGPAKDPDVTVNPLAVVTPGFLRGLFDIFDDGSETNARAGHPKVAPGQ